MANSCLMPGVKPVDTPLSDSPTRVSTANEEIGQERTKIYEIQVKISTVYSLALALHRSLFTSTDPFKQVQRELCPLIVALGHVGRVFNAITDRRYPQIASDLDQCVDTLQHLGMLKLQGDGLVSIPHNKSGISDLSGRLKDIRVQLTSNTQSLNRWNVDSIRDAQRNIKMPLEAFVKSVENDSSRASVTWNSLLLSGDQNMWRELRGEFKDVGISDENYVINLDFIISRLTRATFGGNIPDTNTARQASMEITDFTIVEPPNFISSISSSPNATSERINEKQREPFHHPARNLSFQLKGALTWSKGKKGGESEI
ncbi:hypothetical protein N7468_000505 [Penicillium chermesinum]|uniref:Uncharacterized protein n=1 Tax=Penicillium chermesinum TaxID=63820 RepID=A0A9W9PNG2_9EURO|nr:uncharacterized protein N7468_000505 [Penicillium chermesinum]KAJ5249054.1 hypothetical protein N7468_000505 [Penicillium chermesinum]KAJ6151161.1 hypothetical protein N7470_007755 [Penicillium chermesinum]